MKISLVKVGMWTGVLIAVVLLAAYLPQFFESERYTYQIETIANKCTFDVSPEQSIETVGNSIIITMPIQTSTPCYEVQGTVSSEGDKIVVDLTTKKVGDICAECLGVVTARVTISGLGEGVYGLQVNTPDKSIIQEVEIE